MAAPAPLARRGGKGPGAGRRRAAQGGEGPRGEAALSAGKSAVGSGHGPGPAPLGPLGSSAALRLRQEEKD